MYTDVLGGRLETEMEGQLIEGQCWPLLHIFWQCREVCGMVVRTVPVSICICTHENEVEYMKFYMYKYGYYSIFPEIPQVLTQNSPCPMAMPLSSKTS